MKRLLVISVAALALLVGTVFVVSAQTPKDEGWGCSGPGVGEGSSYDYSSTLPFKDVAQKLGLDAATLSQQLDGGSSIADLAQDAGVSLDELAKIVNGPMADMMGVMAKYGYVSDAQGVAMLERMNALTKAGFERKGYFGGMMSPGMIGGGTMGPEMMGGQRGFSGMVGGFGASQ